MLESLVASILNRVLGSYIENFDPKHLNIGLLSGDVKLGNLRLKRGALDQLQLPIDVVSGHIGSLVLQIPYSNLKSKPVKILIEDVFLLAKSDVDAGDGKDDSSQKRRDQAAKLDKLELWELGDSQKEPAEDKSNFTTSLVTRIIENLQVTIKNIHLRYEDGVQPIGVGLTLGELSALSTTKDWEPAFIANVGNTSHKLVTLDSLAFYWDPEAESLGDDLDAFRAAIGDSIGEHDMLRPINGQGFVTLTKRPTLDSTPKIKAELKFEELALSMNRPQYVNIIQITDQFQTYVRTRQFRRLRPHKTPLQDPRAWSRYAFEAVLSQVRERRRKWTWDYIGTRLRDMKLYVELYKKLASGELTGADRREFDTIQDRYSFEDLVFFRTLAKTLLRGTPSAVPDKSRQQGWGEWLWGSSSGRGSELKADGPLELTEEQRAELYSALDVNATDPAETSSANQVLLETEFTLRGASVRLEPLATVALNGVHLRFVQRPNAFMLNMSVTEFSVADQTSRFQPEYRDIISVNEAVSSEEPFFWFMFEHHPMDRLADSNLFLKSKSVKIVQNARFLEEVLDLFKAPPDQGETVDAILSAANKTVEELREQTRMGLEYALSEHKTLNLKIDVKSPVIIIPLSPGSAHSPGLVLDVGSLGMSSDLVPPDVIQEVRERTDWEKLEELMYDRFTINLDNTQVTLADDVGVALSTLSSEKYSPLRLLEKTTLQFLLELSIVPRALQLTRCRLSINLPDLHMALSNVQYTLLLQTLSAAIPNTTTSSPESSVSNEEKPHVRSDGGTHSDQNQRIFELRFQVSRAELALRRGWAGNPLLGMCLHQFSLTYFFESQKQGTELRVRDLLINDYVNSDADEDLRKIAESAGHLSEDQGRDLFIVNWAKQADETQSVDVDLAAIRFVLTPNSILAIYDFVMSTFAPPGPPPEATEENPTEQESIASSENSASSRKVCVNLEGINVVLNDDGDVLGNFQLTHARLLTELMAPQGMRFDATLGALSLEDVEDHKILSIDGGGDLADFTYDAPSPERSYVKFRSGAVRLNLEELPCARIARFFSRFNQMKTVYDQARMLAFNQAIQVEPGKMNFDVLMRAPVVVFPWGDDTLIAQLGELYISHTSETCLEAGIRNTFVQAVLNQQNSYLLKAIDLSLTADYSSGPMKVKATVPPVALRLSEHELRLVQEFGQALSRISQASCGLDQSEVGDLRQKLVQEKELEPQSWELPVSVKAQSFDFEFQAPLFSVNLRRDSGPLAEFRVENASLGAKGQDCTIKVEASMRAFTVEDQRTSRTNLFPKVVPPATHDSYQFHATYEVGDKRPRGNIIINCPTVFVALDFLTALKDFVDFGTSSSPSKLQEDYGDSEVSSEILFNPSDAPKQSNITEGEWTLDLQHMYLIILADPSNEDTEALVCKFEQLLCSSSPVSASLAIRKVGVYLTRMRSFNNTKLRILDDFSVKAGIDRSKCREDRLLTSTSADIEPLVLRLSLREIRLILMILQSAQRLWSSESPHETKAEASVLPAAARYVDDGSRYEPSPYAHKFVDPDVDSVEVLGELMKVEFGGMRVVIIDSLHQLPMADFWVKPFCVEARNWSRSSISVVGNAKAYANVYSFAKSAWEPLIDSLDLSLDARMDHVLVRSGLTDIEITPETLSLANDIQAYFSENSHVDLSRATSEDGKPYRIRNETGFSIKIWASDSAPTVIADGEEIPWSFYDWRTIREDLSATTQLITLSVLLLGSEFGALNDVPVSRVGEQLYALGHHRLVFDISISGNLKRIVVRSTHVLVNSTQFTMDIALNGFKCLKVLPGERIALPLSKLDSKVTFSVDNGNSWSPQLYWRDMLKTRERVVQSGDVYILATAEVPKVPLANHYPYQTLCLTAPLQLVNYLPFDIDYRLYSRSTKESRTGHLLQGMHEPVHWCGHQHLLLLSVTIPNYEKSEFAIINAGSEKEFQVEDEIRMRGTADGQNMTLRISYFFSPTRGHAVFLMSPYVILNKTGETLAVETKLNRAVCQTGLKLWSFKSGHNAQVRVGRSLASRAFSFDAVGSDFEVAVSSPGHQQEQYLGVSIRQGTGRLSATKIVTIAPRFILCNNLDSPIEMREPGGEPKLVAEHNVQPVTLISTLAERELCLRFVENGDWSAAFVMTNIGATYVRLARRGKPTLLAQIDIVLEAATLFVHIREARDWPFSIRNFTELDFHIHQSNPNENEDIEFNPIVYHVPPRSAMPYSWDFPAANLKEIVLVCDNRKRRVQLAEIGELPPAKFGSRVVDLSVVADGIQQALVIQDYVPDRSRYVARETASTVASTMASFRPRVEAADAGILYELQLKGIGISYINRSNQELFYATLRNVGVKYRVSEHLETVAWQTQWIQVDNCTAHSSSSRFPVLVYPTVLPKNPEEMRQHPTFSGSVTRSTDQSFGLTYVKHATMLLQELTLEADEDFILSLLDITGTFMSSKSTAGDPWCEDSDTGEISSGLDNLEIPQPSSRSAEDIYFEQLHLQPMQLNLSFVRTGALTERGVFSRMNPSFAAMVDALTMTIGNINDAPVRFNALLIENVRSQVQHLFKTVETHYSQEFLYQLHNIIGSADFIGNPVGLFNNISSGFMDLFYEPYLGYTLSDRPQEFGVGLAKGGFSFMRKSVFGVSDSIFKVTGSLSKGLTSMTLDPQFQRQQHQRMVRNSPRHAFYGLSMGATSFYDSVSSGIQGLTQAPMQGAASGGTSGFFRGLGRGLVGLPTKTAIGVLDFASNFSEGVRNTATSVDSHAIARVRLPRVIGSDGLVRPYNNREAVGQMIMRSTGDGVFAKDHYLAHSNVTQDRVVIISLERICLTKVSDMELEWDVTYDQLAAVSMEHTGIALRLRGGVRGPFIPAPNEDTRKFLYKNIGTAVAEFNRVRQTLY